MHLGGPELMIIVGVIVLLFGGSQIPKLARSIGKAKNEFEKGIKDDGHDTSAIDGSTKSSE